MQYMRISLNDYYKQIAFMNSLDIIEVIDMVRLREIRNVIFNVRFTFEAVCTRLRNLRNYLILGVLLGHGFFFRLPLTFIPMILEPYLHL